MATGGSTISPRAVAAALAPTLGTVINAASMWAMNPRAVAITAGGVACTAFVTSATSIQGVSHVGPTAIACLFAHRPVHGLQEGWIIRVALHAVAREALVTARTCGACLDSLAKQECKDGGKNWCRHSSTPLTV